MSYSEKVKMEISLDFLIIHIFKNLQEGHLSVVRVLLTESRINAEAVNLRGQNPLHVLANYPKDNAAAIAEMFLETMPDYDLNRVDVEGNSGEYQEMFV